VRETFASKGLSLFKAMPFRANGPLPNGGGGIARTHRKPPRTTWQYGVCGPRESDLGLTRSGRRTRQLFPPAFQGRNPGANTRAAAVRPTVLLFCHRLTVISPELNERLATELRL
jgi:hypothetical protein